ncbi:hypothetical protein [Paenibacillus sp. ACRRX]|nr:hypothetical protein [Paenibacillus sp. ACRRX]
MQLADEVINYIKAVSCRYNGHNLMVVCSKGGVTTHYFTMTIKR